MGRCVPDIPARRKRRERGQYRNTFGCDEHRNPLCGARVIHNPQCGMNVTDDQVISCLRKDMAVNSEQSALTPLGCETNCSARVVAVKTAVVIAGDKN